MKKPSLNELQKNRVSPLTYYPRIMFSREIQAFESSMPWTEATKTNGFGKRVNFEIEPYPEFSVGNEDIPPSPLANSYYTHATKQQ